MVLCITFVHRCTPYGVPLEGYHMRVYVSTIPPVPVLEDIPLGMHPPGAAPHQRGIWGIPHIPWWVHSPGESSLTGTSWRGHAAAHHQMGV